ncbi:unnamed protein product, partial [Phaeothamnion confervicola]
RKVRSHHPPKVSFPGLQSHAPCTKMQTYFLESDGGGGVAVAEASLLLIEEKTRLHGIPYSDYFVVEARWVVEPVAVASGSTNGGGGGNGGGSEACRVRVGLCLTFSKSTWLRKAIESNTLTEVKEAMGLWRDMAGEWIRTVPAAGSAAVVGATA